jgi:hypothetical protein
MDVPIIKRPVGRPRLTKEEREQRYELYREKNKETQRVLRETNPAICREYRKKYYLQNNEKFKNKYLEMKNIYTLYMEGKLAIKPNDNLQVVNDVAYFSSLQTSQ